MADSQAQRIIEPQELTYMEDREGESRKPGGPEPRLDSDKPLPESPLLFDGTYGNTDGSEAGEPAAPRTSSDSLFFIPRGSSMRTSASSSFFSSEYAQRQLAAIRKRDKSDGRKGRQDPGTQPQWQPPVKHEETEADGDRSEEVAREQIEFASLPSAIEDLRAPFSFDDRRRLPSQTERDTVGLRKTRSS
ncbi:hypothetical protein O1611_g546 [Lasiodiplodia mahajangana]|uniref:Uncharacterized protein n=1 Tax=Lasiodiplodia mahajangana TaxID=1108764 RepID=A0ACC2K0U2_9PEZI|nr:hypothetical protein O1611_g546 [Lasiodiplodia mahajangana]